jgi:hypothetical protein
MFFLTEDAVIVCQHELGIVKNVPSQNLVTIANRRVLVENDPEGRTIAGCPNMGLGIRPCVTTLKVTAGYSDLIRIDGRRVCLDTVTGLTDGTPPGLVKYKVNNAGQPFVQEGS